MHSMKTDNISMSHRTTVFLQWTIGILLALGLADLIYSFTGDAARYGTLYPAAHVLLNIVGFLALSFIWSKEQWAAWLFIAVLALHMVLDYAVGAFHPAKLLLFLPALFFWIALRKEKVESI
jgi:hypothetical protein